MKEETMKEMKEETIKEDHFVVHTVGTAVDSANL